MRRAARPARSLAAALVVAAIAASCGGGGSEGDGAEATTTTEAPGTTTTTSSTTTSEATTTTGAPSTTTEPEGLVDASTAQRSAPAEGDAVALLRDVRIGVHDGYERIVFEFTADDQPGYTVEWVEGPIYADGSGRQVDVAGDALLAIRLEPASGVDLSSATASVVYQGPDRIAGGARTDVIDEVVRTGDFEAVLSWVVGARGEVPFRVSRLPDPARLVIDLEAT